jgi:hypothetical protein
MDSKSVRDVRFLNGYSYGFPLHDESYLVLKRPYSITMHFRCVCVCVCTRMHACKHILYSLDSEFFFVQCKSHETFF